MIGALRYEWFRLRSIGSTYWLVGTALVFQLVFAVLIALSLATSSTFGGGDEGFEILSTIGGSTGAPLLMAYIVGLVGVFSMGHEYRHGMIRATLTAIPNRTHVFVAKVVSTALVAALTAVTCVVIALGCLALFGLDMPSASALVEGSVGLVLFTVLFALSGLAFAALLRNQTAGVAMLMLVPSLFEFIIQSIVVIIKTNSDDPQSAGGVTVVLKYLPYDAGSQMFVQSSVDGFVQRALGAEPFGPVGGGIVMAVFVGALLAGSYALFMRRDA
ncbi:ABC transporter permease [Aeromicrobium fastidiosum]|uniref:ABC transporter permease n=1 Tax=Aeromicrobium fastidiosum TaxID=52699 RepID=A0A641ANT4_9ACTN|nr:ABC transporter permease [Aeromicrobium fastidiosum]KAA1379746.1 ABC transporter permease [Aeromicrobium fastidiosum]MBP2389234.1 ABC-type transport system involved in multi-copper enzyme maturation permease subunit [Aeromicrobium fastidiosum]